jgi:hypothetical protein
MIENVLNLLDHTLPHEDSESEAGSDETGRTKEA